MRRRRDTSEDWAAEQRQLRRAEVRAAKVSGRAQAIAVMIAAVATAAAAFAALQAERAVSVAQQGNAQQAAESQMTTAITAIGGSSPSSQVAGLTLLGENVQSQLNAALATTNPVTRKDSYDAYTTALTVLAEYLREGSSSVQSSAFGPGYGNIGQLVSSGQYDASVYGADEVRSLLWMSADVRAISGGSAPSIDLSHDELVGMSLAQIDLSWLSSAFLSYIDLREANLSYSHWGPQTTLAHAYLQCADLSHARFTGANLAGADLRGANLTGAVFTGANLTGVKTDGAVGDPKGLTITNPGSAATWNPGTCASDSAYWDTP